MPSSKVLEILVNLNQREMQILKSIGKGKSNREIALQLHLTEGTVKNYVTNILGHLVLRDRTQIALWVKENLTD